MLHITPRTLVATEARKLNGMCVTVLPDEILDRLVLTPEAAEAGWQLAEYRQTEARVFVRVTPDRKWVGNVLANKVELAEVNTEVAELDNTFAIVATVGEARPMGWTRTENVKEQA